MSSLPFSNEAVDNCAIGITKWHDSYDVPMIGIYSIHTDTIEAIARSQEDE